MIILSKFKYKSLQFPVYKWIGTHKHDSGIQFRNITIFLKYKPEVPGPNSKMQCTRFEEIENCVFKARLIPYHNYDFGSNTHVEMVDVDDSKEGDVIYRFRIQEYTRLIYLSKNWPDQAVIHQDGSITSRFTFYRSNAGGILTKSAVSYDYLTVSNIFAEPLERTLHHLDRRIEFTV